MGGAVERYLGGDMKSICDGVFDEGSEMVHNGWDCLS